MRKRETEEEDDDFPLERLLKVCRLPLKFENISFSEEHEVILEPAIQRRHVLGMGNEHSTAGFF